jgi:hypothetical protein
MTIKAILCRAYDEYDRKIRGSFIKVFRTSARPLRAEALVFIGW